MNIQEENVKLLHIGLEKLTKVALIKTKKGQVTDVIYLITELDEIFKLFLKKKNNSKDKFIDLFVVKSISEVELNFLQLYTSSFIQIWKTSYSNQSYEISRKALAVYDDSFRQFRDQSVTDNNFESVAHNYLCNQSFLTYFNYIVSETSLTEDFENIANFLFDYIKWIVGLDGSIINQYLNLLQKPVDSLHSSQSTVTLDATNFNQSSTVGAQIIQAQFFNLWKNSFDKNKDGVAYNISTVIELILNLLLSQGTRSKDNISLANYFIRLLQDISFETNRSPNRSQSFSDKATYIWFFNIVFAKEFDVSLISNLQIPLFLSMKLAISDKNKKQFLSFVDSTIHGMFAPFSGLLPDFDFNLKYKERELVENYDRAKGKLKKLSFEVMNLQDYQMVHSSFLEFCETVDTFTHVDLPVRENIKAEYKIYIEKEFKYRTLQQTVIWLGAYCIYTNNFDFIEELFYYNQPKDSKTHWSNQDINPLNVSDIFNYFHRRYELDHNITFLWDGHHDFLNYYNKYIALLLLNAINQNKRKGEDWRNEYEPNFNQMLSTQELDNISRSFDEFKNTICYIKEKKDELEKCGLSIEIADRAITLIENIILRINIKKKEIALEAKIDSDKERTFIESVYQLYTNGGSIRKIIAFYNPIPETNEPCQDEDFLSFGINEIASKSFLALNDAGTYVGFPEAYARKFIFDENIQLKGIFQNNSKKTLEKTDQSMIVSKLDEIGDLDSRVLVFSNLYPSYEIFGSNPDFISLEKIGENERPNLREFVGRYKGGDIYSFYDNTNWKQLLVITKSPEGNIGEIKYYVPTKKFDFKQEGHLFWKIHDLNEETSIIDEIIKEQPYWLLEHANDRVEQESYLREQINLIMLIKMSLKLPDNFQGWHFAL
jgi:hypothetical protein